MSDPYKYLAEQIELLKRNQRATSTPQLGTSSMHDNGTIYAYDANGNQVLTVGYQHDGTTAVSAQNGPVPPTPSKPTVEPTTGGANIVWDGLFTDALVVTEDFARIDVRIVTNTYTDPLTVPPAASIISPSWGTAPVTLTAGDYYAYLIYWTTSGKYAISAMSEQFEVTEASISFLRADDGVDYVQLGPGPDILIGRLGSWTSASLSADPDSGAFYLSGDREVHVACGLGSRIDMANYFHAQGGNSNCELYLGRGISDPGTSQLSGQSLELTCDSGSAIHVNSTGSVLLGTTGSLPPASGTDLVLTSGGRIALKSSSRDLKKEIQEVDATDLIKDLRPVTFRMKDVEEGDQNFEILGLIAEEVAEVSPILVNLDAEGKPASLDTQALITALIASNQALEARVAVLEETVAGLVSDAS